VEQSLKDVLERLGLRQAELAKLLDVSARTVSLWATGETPLPGPVAAYLRVLRSAGAEVLASELRRLEGRDKMFNEGIYGVSYKGENMGLLDGDSGLAVLRNGKILGSDRWGGVFMGRYEYDPVRAHNRVHVRMQIPPEGELVTGFSAGPAGAIIDIVGAFERAAPVAATVVEVAGRPVEIQLTYLAPLPN
jgi:transcriptional regulator with XRE-family HTH domain